MTGANRSTSRRTVLRRLAAAGVALPTAGALGLACTTDEARQQRDAAARVFYDQLHATPAAGAVPTAGATETATVQQAVDLEYLPNPEPAPPVNRTDNQTVAVSLEVKELEGKLADGAGYTYWTFNGTVPGPMIRVLQGDDVELTLSNPADSQMSHNIDLHAVTGPGGGAVLTNVGKGESKSFRFKALHPGVFIYHCATAPIDLHISNGMYGLIVVEPPGGLPPVDREFYVCQGEIYTGSKAGSPGMQSFDLDTMSNELPSYVVMNGAMGQLTGDRALKAAVGDRVRIFFGVGGPNKTSSFHVIGEIFDTVATWGSLESLATSVQTVSVAPGSATMVEFGVEVPGTYLLVDHALSRAPKGGVAHLVVEGPDQPDIYTAI